MQTEENKIQHLSEEEAKEINGGGIILTVLGTIAGAASMGMAAYALALDTVENIGYADGKASCPPPPCTE